MAEWTDWRVRILERVPTIRVATLSARGDPFAIPVRFHFDGAFLYFATPAGSEQMVNLRANRRLAVLADVLENGSMQGFVVQGLAEWVRSERESGAVWEAMEAKYADSPPEEVKGTLVRIKPVRIQDFGA